MATKPQSAITRVNKALASLGRAERLVRGRGYYYLHEGDAAGFPSSSIMMYRIEPNDYPLVASAVEDLFKAAGIAIKLPRDVQRCMWFAKCDRDAVTTVEHPTLGAVPCCQRCADFANN